MVGSHRRSPDVAGALVIVDRVHHLSASLGGRHTQVARPELTEHCYIKSDNLPVLGYQRTYISPENYEAGLAVNGGAIFGHASGGIVLLRAAAKLEEIDADSFTRFAADAGLSAPYLRRRAVALSHAVEAALEEGVGVPGLSRGATAALANATAERAGRLALKAGSQR